MFDTWEALKHIIWPTRCAACEVLLETPSEQMCGECRKAVKTVTSIDTPEGIDAVMALFEYEGAVSTMIAKWKYHEDYAAQKALMSLIPNEIERLRAFIPQGACVIPVPPHPRRLRDRGFDPVWTFASRLCKILRQNDVHVDFRDDALIRTRHTARQATLTHDERLHNLEGAFSTVGPLPGKKLLLVDDVLTTGATTVACATTLRAAGAEWIGAVALAHPVNQ